MTSHRKLPEALTAYRIGDPAGEYPVFSVEGARRVQGRWHQVGDRVIYASLHYSTAMLEKLVHWNGALPPNQHFIEIVIPAGLSYEMVTPDSLPDWYKHSGEAARRFARGWYDEARSVVLLVPSGVARIEQNVIVNADHAEFSAIKPGLEAPVWWDERLFA